MTPKDRKLLDTILRTMSVSLIRAAAAREDKTKGTDDLLDSLQSDLKILIEGYDAEVEEFIGFLRSDLGYKAPEQWNGAISGNFYAFSCRLAEKESTMITTPIRCNPLLVKKDS